MSNFLRDSAPNYVPYVEVQRLKVGYQVTLEQSCRQQGYLIFRRASSAKPLSEAEGQELTSPVKLPYNVDVWGLPVNNRPAFTIFAEQDAVLGESLNLLVHQAGFYIRLENGYLKATGGNEACELDPDEVSRAFVDLGKALDRLPFQLEKSFSQQNLMTGISTLLLAIEIILYLGRPRPAFDLIGYSARLFIFGAATAAGLTLTHYALWLLLTRNNPFKKLMLRGYWYFWGVPSIFLGSAFAVYVNSAQQFDKTVLPVQAQVERVVRHGKGGLPISYIFSVDPLVDVEYAGSRLTSFSLTEAEFTRLSFSGHNEGGSFNVELATGLLGAPLRGEITHDN